MNGYLRQSTASQSRLIGPFVDDTDFKTAETGLTIANTDIKLRANGTTLANKNSGGGTHQINGMYSLTWDATDTANVGELFFSVVVAGALPVFGSYVVLEEVVYDALFAASALGYVADQPVNATKLGGTTQTGRDIGASVLLSSGSGAGQVDLSSGKVLLQPTQTGVTIPTVTTLTDAPGDSSGVTTLLSRLSALRAGYLDNLSAGATALESSLQSLITTIGASAAGVAAAVWSAATRVLTAGTNISLAKGTGVTGFNDLSAADVNAEVDTALADYDGPTNTQLATALADADDATLAAIAALPTAVEVADAVWERATYTEFPSTAVLDGFNRGNEDPATGWTKVFTSDGDVKVLSTQLTGPISSRAVFTSLTPADDQEAFVSISSGTTSGGGLGNRVFLLLRITGETSDDATGYYIIGQSSAIRLYRIDSFSSLEQLAEATLDASLTTGDQVGMRAIGDVLEAWVNIQGAGWILIASATDSTYPSGKIGLGVSSNDDSLLLDDFGGGDFTPISGAGAIANAVWEDDNSARTTADSAGNKLRQALVLYEGN